MDALWDLIALPTLNLPAADASLALAAMVFRTGLLDAADACRRRLRGGAARSGCTATRPSARSRGRRARRTRRAACARVDGGEVVLDDGAQDADAVVVAVPHDAVARSCRRARSTRARSSARHEPDREPARRTTTGACSTSRSPPASATPRAVALRPHRVVGRRARASSSRSRCRAPTAEIGEPRRDAARALPARARAPAPRARAAPRSLDFIVTREPRATFRAAPGTARAAARPAHERRRASTSPARGPTPAGRRRWRARCAAASPPPRAARRDLARGQARRVGGGRRMSVTASPRLDAAAAQRSRAAAEHLLALQHADGWWKGELETNVTIDAEDLFVRQYLGIRTTSTTEATARWIRSKQRDDGTLGDLLRRPGRPLDDGRGVRRAAARRRPGGRRAHAPRRASSSATPAASSARASSRACGCRCSRSGRGSDVPVDAAGADLPAAARAAHHLLLRLLGAADDRRAVDRLGAPAGRRRFRSRSTSCAPGGSPQAPPDHLGRARSTLLDRGLHRYERRPIAPLRRRALRAAERWIVERQEARRLVGRDPAAVGLVDHRAARARLPARPSGDREARSRASTASRSRTRRAAGSRRASRRSGTRALARDRAARRGLRARVTTRSRAARAGSPAARCASAATGRCAGPTSRRAASRSSSRTTTTPTSTTPPSSCSRCAAPAIDDARRGRARRRLVARHAVERRRLGRVRRRQHERLAREAAVLRLRRGDRSAERRRHRAHGRDARVRRARRTTPRRGAASSGCCASRSATARGSAAGARTTSTAPAPSCPALAACGLARPRTSVRVAVDWLERVQNEDGGFGEDLRSYRDARLARPRRVDRVADGVGAARAPRRRASAAPVRRARGATGSSRRSGRTAAGTSRSSPAPASPATSTSTTTSTGRSSR